MAAHKVKTLIYSSTCATYGEPVKMPITEQTPQVSFWFTLSFLVLYYANAVAQSPYDMPETSSLTKQYNMN
jgi:UDP-glucose 4-epimerase